MTVVNRVKSAVIWILFVITIIIWLPLVALVRLFDRDPGLYRTGRFFRWLSLPIEKINPAWSLELSGEKVTEPRRPYVVVANHQSTLDIPFLARMPLECKWVAKEALFGTPVLGWMMRLAGDIPLDRSSTRSGVQALLAAKKVLEHKVSVFFFPEGTRSLDEQVHAFNDGAFHLAIKAQVPVLPMAIEGARACLPKNSWVFGPPQKVRIHILPAIETAGLTSKDVAQLREQTRHAIMEQIAHWRGQTVAEVDALHPAAKA